MSGEAKLIIMRRQGGDMDAHGLAGDKGGNRYHMLTLFSASCGGVGGGGGGSPPANAAAAQDEAHSPPREALEDSIRARGSDSARRKHSVEGDEEGGACGGGFRGGEWPAGAAKRALRDGAAAAACGQGVRRGWSSAHSSGVVPEATSHRPATTHGQPLASVASRLTNHKDAQQAAAPAAKPSGPGRVLPHKRLRIGRSALHVQSEPSSDDDGANDGGFFSKSVLDNAPALSSTPPAKVPRVDKAPRNGSPEPYPSQSLPLEAAPTSAYDAFLEDEERERAGREPSADSQAASADDSGSGSDEMFERSLLSNKQNADQTRLPDASGGSCAQAPVEHKLQSLTEDGAGCSAPPLSGHSPEVIEASQTPELSQRLRMSLPRMGELGELRVRRLSSSPPHCNLNGASEKTPPPAPPPAQTEHSPARVECTAAGGSLAGEDSQNEEVCARHSTPSNDSSLSKCHAAGAEADGEESLPARTRTSGPDEEVAVIRSDDAAQGSIRTQMMGEQADQGIPRVSKATSLAEIVQDTDVGIADPKREMEAMDVDETRGEEGTPSATAESEAEKGEAQSQKVESQAQENPEIELLIAGGGGGEEGATQTMEFSLNIGQESALFDYYLSQNSAGGGDQDDTSRAKAHGFAASVHAPATSLHRSTTISVPRSDNLQPSVPSAMSRIESILGSSGLGALAPGGGVDHSWHASQRDPGPSSSTSSAASNIESIPKSVGGTTSTLAPSRDRVSLFVTGKGAAVRLSEAGMGTTGGFFADGLPAAGRANGGMHPPASVAAEGDALKDSSKASVHEGDVRSEGGAGGGAGPFGGFVTGKGKNIKLSDEAVQRAQKLLAPEEDAAPGGVSAAVPNLRSSAPEGGFGGFVTGKGRKIRLSEEAIQKAQGLLAEEAYGADKLPGPSGGSFGGFVRGNGAKVHLGEESLRNAQNPFAQEDSALAGDSHSAADSAIAANGLGGFVTGMGAKIKLSEEAIQHAHKLLQEADGGDCSKPACSGGKLGGFVAGQAFIHSTGGGGEDQAHGLFAHHRDASAGDEEGGGSSGFGGFVTGKGTSITLSEKALHGARRVLEPVEDFLSKEGLPAPDGCFGGFVTGKGRKVLPSEESVKRAQKLLESEDDAFAASAGGAPSGGFGGFVTGKGKQVKLSEEALQQAQSLLDQPEEGFGSEATGPGTPLSVRSVSYPSYHGGSGSSTPAPHRSMSHPASLHSPAPRPALAASAPGYGGGGRGFQTPITKRGPGSYKPPRSVVVTPAPSSASSSTSLSAARTVTLGPQSDASTPSAHTPIACFGRRLREQTGARLMREVVGGSVPFEDMTNGNIPIADYVRIRSVTSGNAVEFLLRGGGGGEFADVSGEAMIGWRDLRSKMLAGGASHEDASDEWVQRHYRWIVWKLACMERAFPTTFGGWYLTADRVLLQLQNRYEREFVRCEQSFLQGLLHKEQTSTRHIVLCVSSILPAARNPSLCEKEAALQLTDGWAEVGARIDAPLSRLVHQNRIFVGQKLRICSAGLAEATHLQLHLKVNSVCMAEWDAKLGLQKSPPRSLGLGSVVPGGGMVPCVRVMVYRVFPVVFMETLPDGVKIWRSQRAEDRARELHEHQKMKAMEAVFAAEEKARQLEGDDDDDDDVGAGLMREVQKDETRELSSQERRELSSYVERKRTAQRDRLAAAQREHASGAAERSVVAALRFRAVCLRPSEDVRTSECYVTYWRPSEDGAAQLREGKCLEMVNLTAGDVRRDGLVCLSFSRATKTREVQAGSAVFNPRSAIADLGNVAALHPDEIFDAIGLVLAVSAVDTFLLSNNQAAGRRTVVVSNREGRMLFVKVDMVALALPFDPLAPTGTVLGLRNVCRPSVRKSDGSIWCLANEYTELLVDPKFADMAEPARELASWAAEQDDKVREFASHAEEALQEEASS